MRTETTILTDVIFKNNRGKRCSASSPTATTFEGQLGTAFVRGVVGALDMNKRIVKIGLETYPFVPKSIDRKVWEILPIIEPRFGNCDSNLLTSSQLDWTRNELSTGRTVKLSAKQPGTEDVISDVIIDINDENILVGLCGFYYIDNN